VEELVQEGGGGLQEEIDVPGFFGNLVMVLEQNPNLEHAVAFASEHLDERSRLVIEKRLSMNILKEKGIRSLRELLPDWGKRKLADAVNLLESAESERDPAERELLLDRALEAILSSVREEVGEFSGRIKLPSMVIFGMGILVPLALMMIFPVLSFFGGRLTMLQLGLIYCLFLPAFIYVLTEAVERNRPRHISPPPVGVSFRIRYFLPLFLSAILAVYFAEAGFLVIWFPVAALSLSLLVAAWKPFKVRVKVDRAEEEFPDFLLEAGVQMSNGKPLEAVLVSYAQSGQSPLKSAIGRAGKKVQLDHVGVGEALLSEDFFKEIPSLTVCSGIKLALSAAEKGGQSSGRRLVGISEHLRKILELKKDIKNAMSDLFITLRSLSVFFAPLLMAFTARIYEVITLKSPLQSSLSPASLVFVLAVYTVALSALLVDYGIRLEFGKDAPIRCLNIALAMPLALAVFTVAWFASGSLFGFILNY